MGLSEKKVLTKIATLACFLKGTGYLFPLAQNVFEDRHTTLQGAQMMVFLSLYSLYLSGSDVSKILSTFDDWWIASPFIIENDITNGIESLRSSKCSLEYLDSITNSADNVTVDLLVNEYISLQKRFPELLGENIDSFDLTMNISTVLDVLNPSFSGYVSYARNFKNGISKFCFVK